MLNSQQNIMPYAYEMVNDLPSSMNINNASIPALAPSMLTPMNNVQSFMPTMRNMQGTYASGGSVPHYAGGGIYDYLPGKEDLKNFADRMYQSLPSHEQVKKVGQSAYEAGQGLNKLYRNTIGQFPYIPEAVGVIGAGHLGPFQDANDMFGKLRASGLLSYMLTPSQNTSHPYTESLENVGRGLNAHYKAHQLFNIADAFMDPNNPVGALVPQRLRQRLGELNFAEGGTVGLEALLAQAQMNPQQMQQMIPMQAGQQSQLMFPHYKKGGLKRTFKKALNIVSPVSNKALKPLLPVAGGLVGGMLGGPVGASLGSAAGAKLAGGRHSTRNAILAGLGGYFLSGGQIPGLGGFGGAGAGAGAGGTGASMLGGRWVNPNDAATLAKYGMGAGAGAGTSSAGGFGGLGGIISGLGGWGNALTLGGLGASMLGKYKVEPDQNLSDYAHTQMRTQKEYYPQYKTMKRKRLKEPVNGLFYEDVYPDVEYEGEEEEEHMAEGGEAKKFPDFFPEYKPMQRKRLNPPINGMHYEVVYPEPEFEEKQHAHGGYLHGASGGQEDDVDAKLSDGEYVLSADVVSQLGDGNNNAGAKRLDAFMKKVRHHRNKSKGKLPPKSLGIESYLRRVS